MGTLTLLNESGDLTVSWDENQNEKMREQIQQKMDQGYSFFILEPAFYGLFKKKSKIVHVNDIKPDARGNYSMQVRDEDISRMWLDGTVGIGKTPVSEMRSTKRSRCAKEVARSCSVGVRPFRAG